MPDADGMAILKYIRANPEISNIPIIVLSGKDDAASKAEALNNGANDYLIKWPTFGILLSKIRSIL